MTYSSYIVTGGGRTGSHWVEQVINFITDYSTNLPLAKDTQFDCSVFHTHEIQDLINVPKNIKDACCLVFSKRKDIFSQALSFAVSQHTNEWFAYSREMIEPFEIDHQKFLDLLDGCKFWNQNFDKFVRPLYPNIVDLCFEDLVDNQHQIENYVAQKIGIPNMQGSKSWDLNRNPRDYRELVRNWNDLWKMASDHLVSAH